MKISLKELRRKSGPFEAIAQSIEGALYIASVIVDGREYRLVDDNSKTLTRRSVMHVREMFEGVELAKLTIHQVSAYDEMIGQTPRLGPNTLQVPVSLDNDAL
jgi:hypothetical protein